jgi:hypothetical protein
MRRGEVRKWMDQYALEADGGGQNRENLLEVDSDNINTRQTLE